MRPTLLDTPFVLARDVTSHLRDALAFLIKNQHLIVPKERTKEIAATRTFSTTPVSKIFKNIATVDKLNNFMFLDLSTVSRTSETIPEILVSDDLCIDGSAIQAFSVPAFAKKCWINLTPILGKKDSYNDTLFFTDTTALGQLITRAALVQAYQDKDNWLTIKQALTVVEFYATIMAQSITNIYNLDPMERRWIQTLFAIYYAKLIGPSDHTGDKVPALIMRCSFLGSGADILQVIEDIQPYIGENNGNFTLPVLVKIINERGPARLKNYSVQMLYRSISVSAMDSSTMIIAMDYPPYWVYQLLRVASGYKNPVISGIVKTLGLKNKLQGFADDVADNPNLIGALTR